MVLNINTYLINTIIGHYGYLGSLLFGTTAASYPMGFTSSIYVIYFIGVPVIF